MPWELILALWNALKIISATWSHIGEYPGPPNLQDKSVYSFFLYILSDPRFLIIIGRCT